MDNNQPPRAAARNDYEELRVDFLFPSTQLAAELAEPAADLLAQLLADEGYESFLPDPAGLTAYVPAARFSEEALERVRQAFPLPSPQISFSHKRIEGRDWNQEWERHYFQPIVVGDRCVIHSSFHKDVPQCEYDITIDPKMAFGTGHHATTSQVIEGLLSLPLRGRSVIDMGTGTGILAILAAMRGASPVTAIEIDPVAAQNARENVASNGHPEIDVLLGDASLLDPFARRPDDPDASDRQADVLVANINRNIVVADLPRYAAALRKGGTMLLSGFYEHDIPAVLAAATPLGLAETGHTVKGDNWTCLRLVKS